MSLVRCVGYESDFFGCNPLLREDSLLVYVPLLSRQSHPSSPLPEISHLASFVASAGLARGRVKVILFRFLLPPLQTTQHPTMGAPLAAVSVDSKHKVCLAYLKGGFISDKARNKIATTKRSRRWSPAHLAFL
jgi:hypothetical protein